MQYHIDTDMGVDDALAMVVADRTFGGVAVLSSVVGNIAVSSATRNAFIFREFLGRASRWTVLEGAERASCGYEPDANFIHGPDGLGGATSLLSGELNDAVSRAAVVPLQTAAPPAVDEVTIICIGPATNIPALVSWYGPRAVRRLVMMAGVFFDIGNVTPYAEFNVHADPAAFKTTLGFGIPSVLVPLDITRKVQMPMRILSGDGREPASDLARVLRAAHLKYADACRVTEGIEGCFPHDAVAVLAAARPERFHTMRGRVEVVLDGERRGQTSFSSDETSHVEIATGGDLRWVRQILCEIYASAA